MRIVKTDFQGSEISFNNDGWFDATQAAARFGKRPIDWLNLSSTKEYIEALLEDDRSEENSLRKSTCGKNPYVKTSKGGDVSKQGTWLHPKLGVRFAQWLDVRFAIWCDKQIDSILRGTLDQKRARHEVASTHKVMSAILQQVRQENGKATESHHYSNESRLINWALSGKFQGIDRDMLPSHELNILARLEEKNSVLIGRGVDYTTRKGILEHHAIDLRGEYRYLLAA